MDQEAMERGEVKGLNYYEEYDKLNQEQKRAVREFIKTLSTTHEIRIAKGTTLVKSCK
jgi:hypothetical protein